MELKLEIKELEPMEALAIAHIGPYAQIGPVFDQVLRTAAEHGIPMNACLGLYYDDPGSTPAEELRSDAALIVSQDYDGPNGGMKRVSVAGGKYAVVRYQGDFSGLFDAWMTTYRELFPAHQLKEDLDRVGFEWYVQHNDAEPEKSITDICIPV